MTAAPTGTHTPGEPRAGARRPIALITGVSRAGRVGHAIARRLWSEGFDLILTHRPGVQRSRGAAEIIADLREHGGARADQTARADALDLGDAGAVETFAARLDRELPALAALVHNAATYEPTALEGVSAAEAESFFRVNAVAPLLLSRGLAGALSRGATPGAIVAMLDIHAMGETGVPRRGHIAYSMSKAALLEMVLVLARELAPRVRVNGVAPGVVAFPGEGPEADPAWQERYLARVPLGRAGTPDEAAEAVHWLITGATYCTGQVIRVDGGRAMG